MYKLIIEDDEGKTTVVPLIRDEITIGRKEGNTIRLTERNVSRRHAKLVKQNGSIFIELAQLTSGQKLFLRLPARRLSFTPPLLPFRRQIRGLFSKEHPASDDEILMLERFLASDEGEELREIFSSLNSWLGGRPVGGDLELVRGTGIYCARGGDVRARRVDLGRHVDPHGAGNRPLHRTAPVSDARHGHNGAIGNDDRSRPAIPPHHGAVAPH